MEGKVKWFKKGFGFIIGDDGKEYFVHWSSIQMDGFRVLEQQQKVTFEPSTSDKGPEARNVIPGELN